MHSVNVSRPKATYEITNKRTGELLSSHRTRQAMLDNWREFHSGKEVIVYRRTKHGVTPVVEGVWHEAQRPYDK